MRTLCLLLILFLTRSVCATEQVLVDTLQNGDWITYVPQTHYITPSDAPLLTQDGSLWWPLRKNQLGTGVNGALNYDGTHWTLYTAKDGLFDGPVHAIVQLPDKTIWFGGSHKGKAAVAQFANNTWTILTDGLVGKTTGPAALVDNKGRLWLTTEHTKLEAASQDSSQGGYGVLRYDPVTQTWTQVTVANGLAHNRIYDIAEDRDGSLYFATYRGLSHYNPTTQIWTTFTTKDGLGSDKIYRVFISREGLVWCSHGEKDGLSVFNRRTWRFITRNDGMPANAVRSITQTRDGALYFGTHPNDGATGLIRHHLGNWLRVLKKDGLPGDQVLNITEDKNGALWLDTNVPNHLVRYQPDFSKLPVVSDVLHDDQGNLLANIGLHLINKEDEIRAGTTTDLNGKYRLPMFDEDYDVVPLQIGSTDPELVKVLTGAWHGTLKISSVELRLVFHIRSDSLGNLTAKLDSPDQGITGIPTDGVEIVRQNIKIAVGRIRGVYDGQLNSSSHPTQITGEWRQSGQQFALNLQKTDHAAAVKRPQEPKPPYPYLTEDVTFQNTNANITLAGTLTKPKTGGPFPAVILISGSGPQDRDENILGHKPFLVIADHLTRHGIAVLRVDDRGVGKSSGEYLKATTEDLATDALSAVHYLKTHSDIRPQQIGLAGHSEGGLIAPLVAIQSTDVAFIIMLAGPGVPGDRILESQQYLILKANGASESLLRHNQKFITEACNIIKSEPNDAIAERKIRAFFKTQLDNLDPTLHQELQKLGASDPQAQLNALLPFLLSSWMRYFLAHDPADILKKVSCPTLAIIGEKDLQVPAKENLEAIQKAFQMGGNQNIAVQELPGLNHLFQKAQTGSPAEYAKIEETFSPVALKVISDWLIKQTNPSHP